MKGVRPSGSAVLRGVLAVVVTVTALTLFARPAAAQITGPCTATAYQSPTGTSGPRDLAKAGAPSFDITTGTVWHVHTGAFVSGSGRAQSDQTKATVSVDVFGFPIPVIQATGRGTGGDAGPYAVDDWSKFTKSIDVSGSSDGCSGSFEIVVDDQSAARTVAGGAGLGVAGFGALGLAGVAIRRRP